MACCVCERTLSHKVRSQYVEQASRRPQYAHEVYGRQNSDCNRSLAKQGKAKGRRCCRQHLVDAPSNAATPRAKPCTLTMDRRNVSDMPPRPPETAPAVAASPLPGILASLRAANDSLSIMSFSIIAAEAGSATASAPTTDAACSTMGLCGLAERAQIYRLDSNACCLKEPRKWPSKGAQHADANQKVTRVGKNGKKYIAARAPLNLC